MYSTVIGRANKVEGSGCEQAFVGGYGNKYTYTGTAHSDNNFIFGTSNEMGQVSPSKNMRNCALFGFQNKLKNTDNASFVYMIGQQLETTSKGPMFVIGQFNNDTLSLSNAKLILACGASAGSRKNAIEINTSDCKIRNNLQLATDTTKVNAITPALSSPASTDDMTLVTKSHLGATLPMTHLTSQITGIDESSFPLDFSSYWTAARATDANMRISLRINGSCYTKSLYNCLAVDGSFECYRSAYDSGTQTTTFSRYRFGWDYATKNLTLAGSMSWELSDAGAISNVTHGLTGLVITIYQIETY